MKPDYDRTTRECALQDLRTELRAAIERHAQEQSLGDLSGEQLVCIETRSERLSQMHTFDRFGSRGSDFAHYTAAVITPSWLVWAVTSSNDGTTAFSAHLSHVAVNHDDARALGQGDGITITNAAPHLPEKRAVFLGLEPGQVADRFKDVLRQTMSSAKKDR